MPSIAFLIDENFPLRAGQVLEARGHAIEHVGAQFAKATPDHLLLAAAEEHGFVLLTFDNDFKRLIKRKRYAGRVTPTERAGLIAFDCTGPQAVPRLEALLDDIEFNAERARAGGVRFIMYISQESMLIFR